MFLFYEYTRCCVCTYAWQQLALIIDIIYYIMGNCCKLQCRYKSARTAYWPELKFQASNKGHSVSLAESSVGEVFSTTMSMVAGSKGYVATMTSRLEAQNLCGRAKQNPGVTTTLAAPAAESILSSQPGFKNLFSYEHCYRRRSSRGCCLLPPSICFYQEA